MPVKSFGRSLQVGNGEHLPVRTEDCLEDVVGDVGREPENRHGDDTRSHLFEWDHDVSKQQVALRYYLLRSCRRTDCSQGLHCTQVLQVRKLSSPTRPYKLSIISSTGTSAGAENTKD